MAFLFSFLFGPLFIARYYVVDCDIRAAVSHLLSPFFLVCGISPSSCSAILIFSFTPHLFTFFAPKLAFVLAAPQEKQITYLFVSVVSLSAFIYFLTNLIAYAYVSHGDLYCTNICYCLCVPRSKYSRNLHKITGSFCAVCFSKRQLKYGLCSQIVVKHILLFICPLLFRELFGNIFY